MGSQIAVVLNYGELTQFEFTVEDYLYNAREFLHVYANVSEEDSEEAHLIQECQQDISTKCRSMNYTNAGNEARVCMCSGMNNYCTEEPLPMWTQGKWCVPLFYTIYNHEYTVMTALPRLTLQSPVILNCPYFMGHPMVWGTM